MTLSKVAGALLLYHSLQVKDLHLDSDSWLLQPFTSPSLEGGNGHLNGEHRRRARQAWLNPFSCGQDVCWSAFGACSCGGRPVITQLCQKYYVSFWGNILVRPHDSWSLFLNQIVRIITNILVSHLLISSDFLICSLFRRTVNSNI